MAFRINHIHLESREPAETADWFCRSFGFRVLTDETRGTGDRFIRCETGSDTMRVNFSNARSNEELGDAPTGVHYGIEHFGMDSSDIDADVEKLVSLGALLEEGPKTGRGGQQTVFLRTPGEIRVELIQPA